MASEDTRKLIGREFEYETYHFSLSSLTPFLLTIYKLQMINLCVIHITNFTVVNLARLLVDSRETREGVGEHANYKTRTVSNFNFCCPLVASS